MVRISSILIRSDGKTIQVNFSVLYLGERVGEVRFFSRRLLTSDPDKTMPASMNEINSKLNLAFLFTSGVWLLSFSFFVAIVRKARKFTAHLPLSGRMVSQDQSSQFRSD